MKLHVTDCTYGQTLSTLPLGVIRDQWLASTRQLHATTFYVTACVIICKSLCVKPTGLCYSLQASIVAYKPVYFVFSREDYLKKYH